MSQVATEHTPRRRSRRRKASPKQPASPRFAPIEAPKPPAAPRFAPIEAPKPPASVTRLVAAKKAAAAVVIGADFVMSDDAQALAGFNFDALHERDKLSSFLDALYIPKALRDPRKLMIAGPRTRAGNRTNVTAGIWDVTEGRDKIKRWKKWVVIRRRREERLKINPIGAVALVAGFGILLLLGFGVHRYATARRVAPSVSTYTMASTRRPPKPQDARGGAVIDGAQVRIDDAGEILEVRAPDPRSVLIAFCREKRETMCQPVELASTEPPQPLTRFGIFRSFYDLRAIRITRDSGTGAWVAGGGAQPLADGLVFDLPLGGTRVPVDR